MMLLERLMGRLLFAAVVLAGVVCATAKAQVAYQPPKARDLAGYRKENPTVLTRHGPPPAIWQSSRPLHKPDDVDEVTYQSDGLNLKAWLSHIPADGKIHPAVVFCHGGFWFGDEDWSVLKPFLDAGYIVMAPRVRGENGNSGEFQCFYGEVDDIVAAGNFLASQNGVEKSHLFVSGHSAGGTLAAMAVMKDNPFVLSAPIGADLDIRSIAKSTSDRQRQLIVFDPTNIHELESRSAVLFTASLRKPIVLFCGEQDAGIRSAKQFMTLAHGFHKNAVVDPVPGDHYQSLPNSIPEIIRLFNDFKG
jgi:dipeptidyl aminopeptidase/acylaminoacyl peptidase